MAAAPMILVAGAPGVGKAALLSALGADPAASQEDTSLHTLRLDTKYYTADLLVHCQEVSSNGAPALPPATTLDQLQALVLVVDAGSSRSHAVAMDFFKSLQDREFDIQLLVTNKVDSLSGQQDSSSAGPRPAWLQDAQTWCYSNGFEHIEAAAGNPAVDARLQDEDGEQQGVARVLAALQAHLWPNMQQKTPSQPAAAASTSLSGSSSSSSAKNQAAPRLPQQSQPQPEQAADSAHAASAAAVDAALTQQQQQQQQPAQPQKQQQQQQQAKQQQGHAAVLDLDENPFLDGDTDDFEQLMRQVMGARARLSALPDEDRRAAAADLALKLSSMLGLDAGGSGSDSEQEDVATADDRLQPQQH